MKYLLTLAVLLFSSTAFADSIPSVVTYPPGDDQIVVLRKGAPAPFQGQLFDDPTALRWAVWLQQYKMRYSLDLKAAEATCDVKVQHATTLASIEADRTSKIEQDLRKRLLDSDALRLSAEEKLRNTPFFQQPAFWYGVGVVTTVAVVISTAVVMHEVPR